MQLTIAQVNECLKIKGENFRKCRERKNYSIEKMVQLTGLSRMTIIRMERGNHDYRIISEIRYSRAIY